MGWSLEVFSSCAAKITVAELADAMLRLALPLAVAADADEPAPPDSAASDWQTLLLSTTIGPARVLAQVQAQPFAAEQEADPQLMSLFELEIAESDAEDGVVDEQYTTHLRETLEQARWHYSVSVCRNDLTEQEHAVVQTAYALSQICGGIVHDLQSGAWMDASLFENLLAAYGLSDYQ